MNQLINTRWKSLSEAMLRLHAALSDESGQDLIEYALVVALIAFAATAGMNSLASGINTAFGNLATLLTNTIT
jgi:pilus assembly protein Flp/PilA